MAAAPGEKLSEVALAREFGVSRSLLRLSVSELVTEGLLVRAPGRGTFVTDKVLEHNTVRFTIAQNLEYSGADKAAERALLADWPNARIRYVQGRRAESDVRTIISHQVPRIAPAYQPLEFVLERYPDLAPEAFLPEALEVFRHKGRLMALPLLCSAAVLHYNPVVFEAAGIGPPGPDWTWEHMLHAARTLHKPDRNQFGLTMPQPVRLFLTMIWSLGGEVCGGPFGLWNLRHDAAYRAAALFARLRPYVAPVPGRRSGPTREFGHARAAMLPAGGTLPTQLEGGPRVSLRTAPMPQGIKKATWILAEGVSIAAGCVNPDLAAAFVHALAGPNGQQALFDSGLRTPALRSVSLRSRGTDPYQEQMPWARVPYEFSRLNVHPIAAAQLMRLHDPSEAKAFCHHTEDLVNALIESQRDEDPDVF